MRVIKKFELYEVSFVQYPANPYCVVVGIGGRIVE